MDERNTTRPALPEDFTCDGYRRMNHDLALFSDEHAILHYFQYGIREGRIYKPALSDHIYFPQKSGGINLLGYVNSIFGLASSCRMIAQSLSELGFDYNINEFPIGSDEGAFLQTSTESQYMLNIICMNPDIRYNRVDPRFFEGKKNIGLIFWELEELSTLWIESMQFFDEIWVSSRFNKQTLRKYFPGKEIHLLPLPCENVDILDQRACKEEFGIDPETFLCLFIFDYRSDLSRKNPQAAIEAFKMAFRENENCTLIIKTHHFPAHELERFAHEHADDPRIILWNEVISKERRDQLMNACDLYISLHRSEGFGLTIMEALLLGKPVVCTNYSGNLDFCDAAWTELVDYKMTRVDAASIYATALDCRNSLWANPDPAHAAEKIRNIYSDHGFYLQKASKGKAWIEVNYSREMINKQIYNRINHHLTK